MQHFVDESIITARSGNGGPGCVSFRREKYIPYGGPDGGDGGDGGSVIFTTRSNLRTLYHLKYKKNFFAKNGQPGKGKQMHGSKGENIVIPVPPGTMIIDADTDETLKDMYDPDEEFVLLRGGMGGKGNMNFATSTNQAPRHAQPGITGQEMHLRIELKLIADVGLVGFPNAGKSSLLSVVSRAKPKIANYPFTTLTPNLGVFVAGEENFVMADIPGLIEGASKGAGLGFEFLKHVERTKLLLFVIDPEQENYEEQFGKLMKELQDYSVNLEQKPYLISMSKSDLEGTDDKHRLLKEKISDDILLFSSVTRNGIKELIFKLKDKIHDVEKQSSEQ